MHLFGASELFGQALRVWRGTEGAPHHRVGQRSLGGEDAEKKKMSLLGRYFAGTGLAHEKIQKYYGLRYVPPNDTLESQTPGSQNVTLVGNRVPADVIS